MNADAIVKRIMEDANEDARKIHAQADERIARMNEELEGRMNTQRAEALENAKREGAELRERMLRVAELDQRKEQLFVKRQVIDQAFENALAKMRAMKGKEAQDYLLSLIAGAAEGGEEIVVSEEDASLYDGAFLARVNEALISRGARQGVTLSAERRPIGGGFLLKTGGVEINCSYAAVLSQMRANLEAEVAALLF